MIAIPGRTLLTERLALRPIRLSDAEPTARLMTDAIARWTGSWQGEETVEQVEARIRGLQALDIKGDRFDRAVTLRETGALIGWIGVRRLEQAPERGALGYWTGEPWCAQGYTREAARAVVPAAFEALRLETIEATAQVGNAASLAILRGLGMRHLGRRQEFATARGAADLCEWFELARTD